MASIYKRKNSWHLDWYDENGKRHQPSLGPISKKEALANLEYKKAELSLLYSKLNKEVGSASESLMADREIVLEVVRKDGNLLEQVDGTLKTDHEEVLTALKKVMFNKW